MLPLTSKSQYSLEYWLLLFNVIFTFSKLIAFNIFEQLELNKNGQSSIQDGLYFLGLFILDNKYLSK